jgi:glucokinase
MSERAPRVAIGFDIGGTFVKAGRLGREGRIEREERRPTPAREGPEALVRVIDSLFRELVPDGVETTVGVGCAGLVDPGRGLVRTSPNLPLWKEVPLAELLAGPLGLRPAFLNDANAFTLAEWRLGAARGASTVVALTLGTGVGGGLILGGRLWTGVNGFAGEIGHAPLIADGPPCVCGARGCLEALVGSSAIVARYVGSADGRPAGPSGAGSITPRGIAARAREGDAAARRAFEETGRYLGIALRGAVHLLDPDVIVIGGGISGASDLLLPAARRSMRENLMHPPELTPEIRPAELGSAAGWIGAAVYALDAEA